MLIEKYEKELKNIKKGLEAIIDEIYNLEDEEDFEYLKSDFSWACPDYQCFFTNGATKGVIVFQNLGFVIKIPLIYHCGGDEVYGAGGENDWNYCEAELKNYIAAQTDYNIDKCFARVEFIGTIGEYNHPVYIQEYVDTFANRTTCSYHTDEDVDLVRQIINQSTNWDYIDTNWEADMLAIYGRKFYEKVKEFIYRYEINDLHRGNIGYLNNNPVFVDFSGYNSN